MRLADDRDTSALREACGRLLAYATAYNWAKGVDYQAACGVLHDQVAAGNCYIIDGYAVFVDKVTPWYSTLPYLEEWLTMRLYQGGTTASIPPALEAIAAKLGCASIVGGDSSPVQLMTAAYEGAKWQPLTKLFYKDTQ